MSDQTRAAAPAPAQQQRKASVPACAPARRPSRPPARPLSPPREAGVGQASARAERTRAVIGDLAPRLGLDPSRLVVRDDDAAGRFVAARGASGVQESGRVHLHPAYYDPATVAGRYLLAHEAAHVAQRAETVLRPDRPAPSRLAAEREADTIARAFAEGRSFAPPVAVLPYGAVAAENDAPDPDPVKVATLRADLDLLLGSTPVGESRIGEALAAVEAAGQAATLTVVRDLSTERRSLLVGGITGGHLTAHRRGVLLVYGALTADEVRATDPARFKRVDVHGLQRDEYDALVATLRAFPPAALAALLASDNGAALREVMSSRGESLLAEPAAPRTASASALPSDDPRVRAEVALEPVVDGALTELRGLLGDEPSPAAARAALTVVRRLLGAPSHADAGEDAAPPPGPADRVAYVVRALEPEGAIARLVAAVPEALRYSDDFRPAWRAVLRLRPPEASARDAEELLTYKLIDWAVTDAEAKRAFDLIEALARSAPQRVRALDSDGRVDRMFDNLPDEFLYRSDVREGTHTIMRVREPAVLYARAVGLLSRSLFDWAVTANDAYQAFQCSRALPDADRRRLEHADNGLYWKRMVSELTPSMRAAYDLHHVGGARADDERASLRSLLANDATWGAGRSPQLRTLVSLAVALGDYRWAFDRSREVGAHATHPTVVEAFRLYHPDRQPSYALDVLEGTTLWEEGPLGAVAMAGRGIGLLATGDIWLARPSIHGAGLDLEAAQGVLAGDIAGMRLAARASTPGATGATNRADLDWDAQRGVLHARIADLRIASFTYVGSADQTTRFRNATIKGLRVDATYPKGTNGHATEAVVEVVSIVLNDLVLARTGGMVGVARLVADALRLRAGGADVPQAVGAGTTPGGWTFPFFGNIGDFFANGLAAYRATDDVNTPLTTVRSYDVRVGRLLVEGVYTGGREVARVELADLTLRAGNDRSAYLRQLVRALDERIARATPEQRPDLVTQRASAVAALATLRDKERDLVSLTTRSQADPNALSPAERTRLAALRAELRGGVVVDVGRVDVRGLSGGLELPSMTLTSVSGEGESGALFERLTDPQLVQRFVAEGAPGAGAFERAGLRLRVGDLDARNLVLQGSLRKASEIAGELRDLPADAPTERRAELTALLGKTRRLEALTARLTDAEGGLLTSAERTEYAVLLAELRSLAATRVGRLRLGGVTVGVGLDTGVHSVGARTLLVQDLVGPRYSVRRITGRDVTAGGSLAPGSSGFSALPAGLERVAVSAGALGVEGVRVDGTELPMGGLSFTGLDVAVTRIDTGYRVALTKLDRFAIDGLNVAVGEHRVSSPHPVELTGVTGVVVLTTANPEPGKVPAINGVRIESLTFGGINATALHYENLRDHRRVDVTARLRGLHVAGVDVPLDGKRLPRSGSVSLAAIDQLTVAASIGQTLSFRANLTSRPATGGVLRLHFVETGVRLDHVDLGTIDVSRFRWRSADNAKLLEATQPVTLRGVRARADVTFHGLDPIAAVGHTVGMDAIVARHLHYRDATTDVELIRPASPAGPPFEVRDVRLTGARWAKNGAFSGSADVGSVDAGVRGTVHGALVHHAELHATGLHVDLTPQGRVSARVQNLDARADVTAGGTRADVSLRGLSLDQLTYDNGVLEIGADGTPGLALGELALTRIDLRSAAANVTVPPGVGRVTVEGARLRATLTFGRKPDGGVDFSVFRAAVHELGIAHVRARGVVVELPTKGLTITVPAATEAVVSDISVRPQPGDPAFAVDRVPSTVPGAAADARDTTVQGILAVQSIVVPRILAAARSGLRAAATINATGLTLGVLRSGEATVDLATVAVTNVAVVTPIGAPKAPAAPPSTAPIDLVAIQRSILDGVLRFEHVLPHLNGRLKMHLLVPAVSIDAHVDTAITAGSLNPFELERQLVPPLYQPFIDFETTRFPRRLVLELDPSDATMPFIGVLPGLLTKTPLLEWDLSTGEYDRIQADKLIEISRLLRYRVTPVTAALTRKFTGGPPGSGPGPELRGIDIRLSLDNPSALDLELGRTGATGTTLAGTPPAGLHRMHVRLAPRAVVDLRLHGDLPGPRAGLMFDIGAIGLDQIEFVDEDPADRTKARIEASLANLRVSGVTGVVDFAAAGWRPTSAAAGVRSVAAERIHIRYRPAGAP